MTECRSRKGDEKEKEKKKESKTEKMKPRYYWFLERNVKNLLKNEDGAFANWISAGKELTLEHPRGGGGQMDPPIGFLDLKFEAFKQSK